MYANAGSLSAVSFFLCSRRTHIDIDKKELQDEIVLLYCRKIGDGIATQITIYKSQWIESFILSWTVGV